MLVVHPSSRCDVCLVEYNWETSGNQPYAIACGHIFCRTCLFALTPPLCPLCRKPFLPPKIKKLHVDRPDPSDPEYPSNPSSSPHRSSPTDPTTTNPHHLSLTPPEHRQLDLVQKLLLAWSDTDATPHAEEVPPSPARSPLLLLQLRLRPLLMEVDGCLALSSESGSLNSSSSSRDISSNQNQWHLTLLKTRSIITQHTHLKEQSAHLEEAHEKLEREVRELRTKNRDLSDAVVFEQEKAKRVQEVFGVQVEELKRQIHTLKKTNKQLYHHNITYTPQANPLPQPPAAIVAEGLPSLVRAAGSAVGEGYEGYNGYDGYGYTNGNVGYDNAYGAYTPSSTSTSSRPFAHISEYGSEAMSPSPVGHYSNPASTTGGHYSNPTSATGQHSNYPSYTTGPYANPTQSGISTSPTSSYVQPRIAEPVTFSSSGGSSRSRSAHSHTPSLHSHTPSLHSHTPVLPRSATSTSISPTTPAPISALSTSPSRARSTIPNPSMPPPLPASLQALPPVLQSLPSMHDDLEQHPPPPTTTNVFSQSSDPYNLALAAISSYANGYVRGQEQAMGVLGGGGGGGGAGGITSSNEQGGRQLAFSMEHDVVGRRDDDDDEEDDDDEDGEDEEEEEVAPLRAQTQTQTQTRQSTGLGWNNRSSWGTPSQTLSQTQSYPSSLSFSNLSLANSQSQSQSAQSQSQSAHPTHSTSNPTPSNSQNPTSNSNSNSNQPPPSPVWSNATSWHTHRSIPQGQREGSIISGLRMLDFPGWDEGASVRSGMTGRLSALSGGVNSNRGGGPGNGGGGGRGEGSGSVRSGLGGLGLRNLDGGWESMSGVMSSLGVGNANGNGGAAGHNRRDSMMSFGESVTSSSGGAPGGGGTGGGGEGGGRAGGHGAQRPQSPSRPVVSMVGVLPRTAEEDEDEDEDEDGGLLERRDMHRSGVDGGRRGVLGLGLVGSPEVEYAGSGYPGLGLSSSSAGYNSGSDLALGLGLDDAHTYPSADAPTSPPPLNPPMRRARNIMPLPVTSPFGSVMGSPVSSIGRLGSVRGDSGELGSGGRERDRGGERERERERDRERDLGRERERDARRERDREREGGGERDRERVTEDGAYYYRTSEYRHATTGSADYRRDRERERDRDRERERDRDRDRERERDRERDRDREYHTYPGSNSASHSRSYSYSSSTNPSTTSNNTSSGRPPVTRSSTSTAGYYSNPTRSQGQSQSQSAHRHTSSTSSSHSQYQSQSRSSRPHSISPPPTAPLQPLQSFGNALGLDLTTVQPGAPPIAPRPVSGSLRRFGMDGSWE